MPCPISSPRSLPDWGDFCPSCRRLACRCAPEPDVTPAFEAAYRRGHSDCLHDGYDERPMTEWVYATGSRAVLDPEARAVRHLMVPVRFVEFSWRRHLRSEALFARWFESTYGLDLGAYLAGYDDAGCGLPSAVDDPDGHAEAAAALGL